MTDSRVARFFSAQHTKTGKMYQNGGKIYQMPVKYAKWTENRPNGLKIFQHLPLQDPPKLTQIGIFGLKRNHLATLTDSRMFGKKLHKSLSN
jgi:hypothetical protein